MGLQAATHRTQIGILSDGQEADEKVAEREGSNAIGLGKGFFGIVCTCFEDNFEFR